MKFRKKPIFVEAEQFKLGEPIPRGICFGIHRGYACGCGDQPHVHTIHAGQHVAVSPGDWILPEPDGEHFYPVKPDIFQATYEPAE